MKTKQDLVNALLDLPCGSGCSLFADSVNYSTLDDFLPEIASCLCDIIDIKCTLDDANEIDVDVKQLEKELDEKVAHSKEFLLTKSEDELWDIIGAVLEDIENDTFDEEDDDVEIEFDSF